VDPKEFIVPLLVITALVVLGAIVASVMVENLKRRRSWKARHRDEGPGAKTRLG
jgi:hypothetical protein